MKTTLIGTIDQDIECFDWYSLVELSAKDKALAAEAEMVLIDWVRTKYEEDTRRRTGSFCYGTTVLAGKSDDEFIAIAHMRRNP